MARNAVISMCSGQSTLVQLVALLSQMLLMLMLMLLVIVVAVAAAGAANAADGGVLAVACRQPLPAVWL